jgi:Fur family ferric uptake transcriptional regulator
MNATDILLQHDVKKTLSRIALINALRTSNQPLSEPEIRDQMQDQYDRITFYRNVQTLADSGIIHRIVIDNTHVKYALNCCEKGHQHTADHVHFFCKECGKTLCMDKVPVSSYSLPEGFVRKECDVVIKGYCNRCSATIHA